MIMKRITDCASVMAHKAAFFAVWHTNPYLRRNLSIWRVLRHDSGKAINILIFGDRIATRIHRHIAGHHNFKRFADKIEAFCDWECARITKPSKPLTGAQTWAKYYSHLDMAGIVDSFHESRVK